MKQKKQKVKICSACKETNEKVKRRCFISYRRAVELCTDMVGCVTVSVHCDDGQPAHQHHETIWVGSVKAAEKPKVFVKCFFPHPPDFLLF